MVFVQKKLISVLLVLAMLLTSSGVAFAEPLSGEPFPGDGGDPSGGPEQYTASGKIRDMYGKGMAGVDVVFDTKSGGMDPPPSVTTNVYGDWSQYGFWSDCTYTVTPTKEGYVFRDISGNSYKDFGSVNKSNLNFTVYEVLSINTTGLQDGVEEEFYSEIVEATGGNNIYTWSIVEGALPPGLKLDEYEGCIFGEPTAAGVYEFTLQVTDDIQEAEKVLSIKINPDEANLPELSVDTTGLPSGTVGESYNATLQASGGTQPYSWSIAAGSLPAGLSLEGATISGTPAEAGTSSFTVQVTGVDDQIATKALSITVSEAVPELTVDTTSLPSGTVGKAYNATLQASGGTQPYSWSIAAGSLPAGLSLEGATISGTPAEAGTSSFTVQVTGVDDQIATKPLSIIVSEAVPSGGGGSSRKETKPVEPELPVVPPVIPAEVVLEAINVTPSEVNLSSGGEPASFTATGRYSDGTTKDVTASADWNSSDPTIARVTDSGKVQPAQPLKLGTVKITAALDGKSDSAQLTVTEGIQITPAEVTLLVGGTQNFQAKVKAADGTERDITQLANWTVSDTTLAEITGKGTVCALKPGLVTVTASYGNLSGAVEVCISDNKIPDVKIMGAWQGPNQVILRWVVNGGWLPPGGWDLYRVTGNSPEEANRTKIASGLGSQRELMDYSNVISLGGKNLRLNALADLTTISAAEFREFKELYPEIASVDDLNTIIHTAPQFKLDRGRGLTIKSGKEQFRNAGNMIKEKLMNRPELKSRLQLPQTGNSLSQPVAQQAGYSVRQQLQAGRLDPSLLNNNRGNTQSINLGNVNLGNLSIDADRLDQITSNERIKEIKDARNMMLTAANLNQDFAESSGFGFTDSQPGKLSGSVKYEIVPSGINVEALIAAGKTIPSTTIQLGRDTRPDAPANPEGYGMDGKVYLRWDLPTDLPDKNSLRANYARSVISGYVVERKMEGQAEFKALNEESPTVIGYTKNSAGELVEPAVFFTDNLSNGERAQYRVKAKDIFGRLTDPSRPVEIEVKKTLPPPPPTLLQPVTDKEIAATSNGMNILTGKNSIARIKTQYVFAGKTIQPRVMGRFIAVPFTPSLEPREQGAEPQLATGLEKYVVYRSRAYGAGSFSEPQEYRNISLDKPGGNVELGADKVIFYDSDVEPGYFYKYWVAAVDSYGNESVWSNAHIAGYPLEDPPAAPAELNAEFQEYEGLARVSITLDAPDGSGKVILRSADNPAGFFGRYKIEEPKIEAGRGEENRSEANAPELSPDSTNVMAVNLDVIRPGEIPVEEIQGILPVSGNFTSDSDGSVNINPDGSVTVRWMHAADNDVIGYRLYCTVNEAGMSGDDLLANATWVSGIADMTQANMYRLGGLPEVHDGSYYFMVVKCRRPAGSPGESPVPKKPAWAIKDMLMPGGHVVITWSPGQERQEQIHSYRVYRAEVERDQITSLQSNADESSLEWSLVAENLKDTRYREKVDQTKVHYYLYKVTAVDVWGQESEENISEPVRIPTTLPPETPQMLMPIVREDVTLRWKAAPDAANYIVYRKEKPVVPKVAIKDMAANILQLDDSTALGTVDQLRQVIAGMNDNQQIQLFNNIRAQFGVLALAPYGMLDRESAREVEWTFQKMLSPSDFIMENGICQWADDTVEYPNEYLYTIAAVNEDQLVSDRPGPVSAAPFKKDPPPAPEVTIRPTGSGPHLSWEEPGDADGNDASEVKYIVFRSARAEGPFYQISGLLAQTGYIDSSVQGSRQYWYTVKALDECGMLSAPSVPQKGGRRLSTAT
jgi:hypothetical protein